MKRKKEERGEEKKSRRRQSKEEREVSIKMELEVLVVTYLVGRICRLCRASGDCLWTWEEEARPTTCA